MTPDLSQQVTQEVLAQVIGVSQQRVSELMVAGVIPRGGLAVQIRAYTDNLRAQAAKLQAADGQLDLVQERAALAQVQREAHAIKNRVLRREYAPFALLSWVLACASQAIGQRIDELPAELSAVCPGLPPAAAQQIATTIASAGSEWRRATSEMLLGAAPQGDSEDEFEPDEQAGETD